MALCNDSNGCLPHKNRDKIYVSPDGSTHVISKMMEAWNNAVSQREMGEGGR